VVTFIHPSTEIIDPGEGNNARDYWCGDRNLPTNNLTTLTLSIELRTRPKQVIESAHSEFAHPYCYYRLSGLPGCVGVSVAPGAVGRLPGFVGLVEGDPRLGSVDFLVGLPIVGSLDLLGGTPMLGAPDWLGGLPCGGNFEGLPILGLPCVEGLPILGSACCAPGVSILGSLGLVLAAPLVLVFFRMLLPAFFFVRLSLVLTATVEVLAEGSRADTDST
jgi:hypothetical protein